MIFLTIYCLLILNIAIHEFSHALMCLFFHKSIASICIGEGLSFTIYKLKIGFIPLRGHVDFKFKDLSKFERYLIFLSGPLATGGLLLLYKSFYFMFKQLIIIQLIIQLILALIPINGSDLSNAFMTGDCYE